MNVLGFFKFTTPTDEKKILKNEKKGKRNKGKS